MMKLSVVIPVYNERQYLGEIMRRVREAPLPAGVRAVEIVAVDDGSDDGSREWLQAAEKRGELKLILQPRNLGKGAAVRAGIARTTGDVVLIQDADLEYNPKDYPALLAPIVDNRADVVFGSRFLGQERRVLYFWHTMVNRFLSLLANALTNTTFTDIECCYKALRGELARSLRMTSNRFGIEPELTARVARAGVRLFEVGVNYNGRTYEEGKKIGAADGIAALFHIVRFSLFGGSPYKPGLKQTLCALRCASDRFYCEPVLAALKTTRKRKFNRILEVGSGIGAVTRALIQRGQVVASDHDEDCIRQLHERFQHYSEFEVVRWDATRGKSDPSTPATVARGGFDLIVAVNVLEHLDDDSKVVAQWKELLSEGGFLVLLVPYSQMLFSPVDKAVGHLRRYNRRGLAEIAEKVGVKVVHMSFSNPLGILGWIVNGKILRRSELPAGMVRFYALLKPVIRPIEWVLSRFVGLSIVAVFCNQPATMGSAGKRSHEAA
jgi:SAM-dependent methyltransferase